MTPFFADKALVAGLGNPGPRYAHSRHNIGFMVVDHWVRRHNTTLSRQDFKSLWTNAAIEGQNLIIAKPQTYMNLSGQAVVQLLAYFHLPRTNLIVVHDDLDLEFGRIKVSLQGGPGGHRGVSSIIDCIGARDFTRVKLGIGRPRFQEPVEDFVLSGFYPDQHSQLPDLLDVAADALDIICRQGPVQAQQQFNGIKTAAATS